MYMDTHLVLFPSLFFLLRILFAVTDGRAGLHRSLQALSSCGQGSVAALAVQQWLEALGV